MPLRLGGLHGGAEVRLEGEEQRRGAAVGAEHELYLLLAGRPARRQHCVPMVAVAGLLLEVRMCGSYVVACVV